MEQTNRVGRLRLDVVPEPEKRPGPKPYEDPFAFSVDRVKKFDGLSPNFKRRKFEKNATNVDGTAGTKQQFAEQTVTIGYGMFDVVAPPYNLDELASLFDNSAANHSAIMAKVANIVGLGFDFDLTDATRQKLEEAPNPEAQARANRRIERVKSELRSWLDKMNNEDTFTHTLEKVWTDVESVGNGYIEIGRTVTGEIGYIGHIPAVSIRVRRSKDGFVQIVGNRVVFFKSFKGKEGNPITSDPRPNEIIHIKKYSPRNGYYGVPDTVAGATSIVGNELAGKYNIDYFENKAVPRHIITLKGATMDSESEEKLFRFLQTGLRGQNHRTLFIPLPPDTETSKVEFEMNPVEAQTIEASFIEYQKMNTDNTLMAHGVPRSRVGGESTAQLAAALSQDRTFKEQVARPAQDRLEKMLNGIIEEKTDIVQFKLKELTLTDETTQSQIDERYLRMQVITPNEVRPRLGHPPRKGGDDVVDLKAQPAADATAQATGSRQRDQQRTANNSDSTSTTTGRNPQGEGRKQH